MEYQHMKGLFLFQQQLRMYYTSGIGGCRA